LLAVVAALALLVPIGIGLGSAVSGFFGGGTTQTIDRSPDALLLSVRDIADYHAATGTYQVLVDVEQENSRLPRMLSSERSTLFATGSVDARVDFSRLGSGAITTSPDGKQATIHLPAPTLAPAVLDPAQTRVVGRQRGLVQRVEGRDQRPAAGRQPAVRDRLGQAQRRRGAERPHRPRGGQHPVDAHRDGEVVRLRRRHGHLRPACAARCPVAAVPDGSDARPVGRPVHGRTRR
jgi:hypothetical protein